MSSIDERTLSMLAVSGWWLATCLEMKDALAHCFLLHNNAQTCIHTQTHTHTLRIVSRQFPVSQSVPHTKTRKPPADIDDNSKLKCDHDHGSTADRKAFVRSGAERRICSPVHMRARTCAPLHVCSVLCLSGEALTRAYALACRFAAAVVFRVCERACAACAYVHVWYIMRCASLLPKDIAHGRVLLVGLGGVCAR